jgi:hypothetical protein|tara:strand:+ start:115 stop:273 length:159 start_codon:yes stop_codon:yes gene_type:complete
MFEAHDLPQQLNHELDKAPAVIKRILEHLKDKVETTAPTVLARSPGAARWPV